MAAVDCGCGEGDLNLSLLPAGALPQPRRFMTYRLWSKSRRVWLWSSEPQYDSFTSREAAQRFCDAQRREDGSSDPDLEVREFRPDFELEDLK